jgi:uncharacterized protein
MRHFELWKRISRKKTAASSPIHGLAHWKRVYENGLIIARETGASSDLVELFALFHDSCRLNDGKDPDHGRRAAEWVASMRSDLPDIPEDLFQFLLEALRDHTHVQHTDNIHIATCWDADRLDLGRVGTIPDPAYMNTEMGRIMSRNGGFMMETLEQFVERLIGSVGCYFHKCETEMYSLKKNDTNKKNRMGVFAWVKELKRDDKFEISTYKTLGDEALVSQWSDKTVPGMHYVSKNKDTGEGTGIVFYIKRGSHGHDYEKAVRSLRAILLKKV